MKNQIVLSAGEIAIDNDGNKWIVATSTGRTAYLHPATVEVDGETGTVKEVNIAAEGKGAKFVNGKEQGNGAVIRTQHANLAAYIRSVRDFYEARKAYEARRDEEARKAEAEAIEQGEAFWANPDNVLEIVHRNDDGTYMFRMEWHNADRYGNPGTWHVQGFVGKPRSYYGARDSRSVDIMAMHTEQDGFSNRFMTSGTAVGHSLEALAAAVMQAVIR